MEKSIKVALCQIDVALGEPAFNALKVKEGVEKSVKNGAKAVIFPELWNTGYDLDGIPLSADWEGEETTSLLSSLARKHRLTIIGGSVAERKEDGIYNTSFVFSPDGKKVAEYRKIHLFRLMNEEKYLKAGNKITLFNIEGIKASIAICYDIRFPEWIRKMALEGSQILFVPAEWPHPRLHHWRQLLIARAIENQMYVVACNRVGEEGETIFCGHSMVISPWGEVIVEGKQKEEVIYAELDMTLVDRVRGEIPVFQDRRVDLY
ncbi:carbon-nitrogen family hydrolase [Microaerobacter geothermalis]|uniref:carbon-nitrogen family hydrolase n=1 Tax=Microaerobacter geothermalis TaxID=674972 RepID=UPI001F3B4A1C|nr:carbon-nitrogen family hydrolase [Microaerobacter geothermalis]MCF6094962.1 carbon-nitrogen family hydrolase [Microaerobacter geothermalis]